MKNTLTFIAMLLCLATTAQTKKVSVALSDSIVMTPGAIEINPVIVTAQGDTARSLNWYAFDLQRDDTAAGCNTYVQLFDKNGKSIAQFNQHIPASVVKIWGVEPTPVDDYIFKMNPRFVRTLAKN